MSFIIFIYAFLFCINIFIIIWNVGALNAYFQHIKIVQSGEYKKQHFIQSILLGIFGILILPVILIVTSFPTYGLRYWNTHFGRRNIFWEELYQEAKEDQRKQKRKYDKYGGLVTVNKYGSKDTGMYISIWEE